MLVCIWNLSEMEKHKHTPFRTKTSCKELNNIYTCRVLKCDVIKNLLCETIGFLEVFHERTIPKRPIYICQKIAFHGKSHCLWDISAVMLWWLHTNPSKFDSGHNIRNQIKFRRICMESSEQNRPSISETICPTMLGFGK